MSDVKVWRISMASEAGSKPVMALVVDGETAYYVFDGEVQSSADHKAGTDMASDIEWNSGAPADADGWLGLLLSGHTYYSADGASVKDGASVEDVIAEEQKILSNVFDNTTDPAKERQLSDDLAQVTLENPDLDDFFSSEDPNTPQPDSMRHYIRTLIESRGTWDLNPKLHEWLNGGPPPTEDTGPLILFRTEGE